MKILFLTQSRFSRFYMLINGVLRSLEQNHSLIRLLKSCPIEGIDLKAKTLQHPCWQADQPAHYQGGRYGLLPNARIFRD